MSLLFEAIEPSSSFQDFTNDSASEHGKISRRSTVDTAIEILHSFDSQVEIRAIKGQIDNLLAEICDRASNNQRVLVTTLTKRKAEDLANYYTEVGVRCRYMHSEDETLELIRLLRDLSKASTTS